jgi:hypothetical protein
MTATLKEQCDGGTRPNKRRDLLLGIGFLVIAVFATLIVGEIVLRIVASQHLIYNIEMVKYAKELKMRDPLGEVSHVHRPSSSARLMGVDISLNSLGDRGPELSSPKPIGCKRVLVMGSSITMGWGVPFEKTFTAATERLLDTNKPFGLNTSFEFVNAGIGNYNNYFQYRLFLRQYPVVKPDMVVLHYFIGDVQPRGMGNDSFILRDSYLAAFFYNRWSEIKLKFSGQYKDLFTFYKDLYADNSEPWKQTQHQISEMRDITAKDGIPFLVMIQPDIHDLAPGTPYKDLYAKMETAFKAMGIPTINAFDPFQKEFGEDVSKLWIQSDDPHPNASGHALMARILYDYLVAKDPLKLKSAQK